jgi:hypothetical protein
MSRNGGSGNNSDGDKRYENGSIAYRYRDHSTIFPNMIPERLFFLRNGTVCFFFSFSISACLCSVLHVEYKLHVLRVRM